PPLGLVAGCCHGWGLPGGTSFFFTGANAKPLKRVSDSFLTAQAPPTPLRARLGPTPVLGTPFVGVVPHLPGDANLRRGFGDLFGTFVGGVARPVLEADLPATAQRPIKENQVQGDVALGLGRRVLLRHPEVDCREYLVDVRQKSYHGGLIALLD